MATISTSGISAGQIIRAEHLLRVINALDGTNPNNIIITAPSTISGSLSLTGSLSVTGSAIIKGLTNTAQTNVLTYNVSTGQLYYTASSALALTGSISTPGGSNTQIQFNSGSVLSGSSAFIFSYNSSSVLLGSGLSTGLYALAQGNNVTASANFSTAIGSGAKATALGAHAEGSNTQAIAIYSHAEGRQAIASGSYSHAEGYLTMASGDYSHAEGENSQAIGDYSHAEGTYTIASGSYSHAEGDATIALGNSSHAEGSATQAIGQYSHAEGDGAIASGYGSHAEGDTTQATGDYSHAEGYQTQTIGLYSHAEGWNTVASGSYQHVQGQFNISSSVPSAFIIGNGTSDSTRSNLVFTSGSEFQITGSSLVKGIHLVSGSQIISGSHIATSNHKIGADLVVGSATQNQVDGNGVLLLYRAQSNMSFILGNPDTSQTNELKLNNTYGSSISSSGFLTLQTSTESVTLNGSGSINITGSLRVSGSITGSLFGTASRAVSASYVAGADVGGFVSLATDALQASKVYTNKTNTSGDFKILFTDNLNLDDNSDIYKEQDSTFLYNPGTNRLTVGAISASSGITGSLLINDVAVLTPRSTTPASPTNGMLIVSGSGADQHIYCYLNNTWKQLDN